ncbi:PKD domain-containing protein [Portibacter marinus]|uniref:PKD domain-containing protein n=1 Tax=Portibacter marinus TaxID=2898660 RepID=UPI001F23A94F|nr:PKD domain-containing protein [Portibacter marinus]
MKIISKVTCALALLLSTLNLHSQSNLLYEHFETFEISTFDSRKLKATAHDKRNDFIRIPFRLSDKRKYDLELTADKLYSEDYLRRDGGIARSKENLQLPIVLRGYGQHSNQIRATITVNDEFLYGRIVTLKEVIYFEPLRTFDPSADPNQIVIYRESDVIDKVHGTCAASENLRKADHLKLQAPKSNLNNRSAGECLQVDLAIANDHTMKNHYGSNSAVSNFNAGVIANVNTDYDDAFNDEIRFVIVETYIAQNSGENDWGATSDVGALLNNFSSWAPSGFNNSHDLGELWTRTDVSYNGNNSTIGLAWVGTVCATNHRYHVLEDYGGNASGMRNLVSHEIGHNFDQSHDSGGGFIMSGSVNGSTTWSSASISGINSYYPGLNCLGSCSGNPPGGSNPPVADFNAEFISECNPTRVRFNDQSSNNPTSWSWQFQNGTPSTSTQQNPAIDFPGAGSYRVTLTATNDDGSDTKILDMNLNGIGNPPNSNFTYSVSGYTVTFDNNTTNGLTYFWDFGDTNSSSAANPSHTYSSPGTYTVVLISENDCGSDSHSAVVTIVDQVTADFSANATEICEGDQVTFFNESSNNAETFEWEFENGTPSTSNEENPTVTFNSAGSYNVRLTVTGGGSTDEELKSNFILVSGVPNTSFTTLIDGYTVDFDNNTTGGVFYNWEFGDGESSTSPNPTHTYANSGTYNVTLTSSNNCGSEEYIAEIIIADEVTASFEVNQTLGCTSDEYVFTNTSSGNITEYYWEFEGGIPATSTEENPVVTFTDPGTRDVRLTVSNSLYEDRLIKDNYISIIGQPEVDFTFEVVENTVTFDNITVGGYTFLWNFGDGNTSIIANPTHTYDGPGDYNVILQSENDCESAEIEKLISIESDLVAAFSADQQEICAGESVNFTNMTNGDFTSILWEFEGGSPSTSTEENPIVVFADQGAFNVKLTVSDGVISDTENKIDFVISNGAPQAIFSSAIDGYSVSFENLSVLSENSSWDFGDGTTSNSLNPNHTYDSPGTYDVTLVVGNECGEDEIVNSITIEEILEASFTSSQTEVCEGESITFESNSTGEIASYFWEFAGGTPATSTEANPVVSFANAGIYDVKLTITSIYGGADAQEATDYLTISDLPVANFNYVLNEFTVSFTNLSENFSAVNWNFGDGNTSNSENPVHTFSSEGDYTVILTSEGPCGTDVKEMIIPVYDELLANFMASETTLCPGEEVELVDLSSGSPTEWEWTIDGEVVITIEEQNPVILLEEPGEYTVELTVRNNEEEDSKVIQQYIEVMPLPESSFDFTQNELEVSFKNNSENGINFTWDFGDGATSSKANPNHSYAEEGEYLVMLRVENECSVEETEQLIGVYNRLIVGFNAVETDVCTSSEVQFTDLSSGNAVSWEWSFPGGNPSKSNEQNPVVTYLEPGLYDVSLTVKSNTDEVTESKSRFINVSSAVTADFEYQVDKNKVSFTNKSENADAYLWSFESNEANPVYEFTEEKAYEVTLKSSNGCSSQEKSVIIDLYEEAKTYANFSIEGNSYCLGDEISFLDLSSDDVTDWSWKFPGGSPEVSTEKNPSVMYSEYGIYDVELTVSNGFNVRTILLEDYVNVLEKPIAGFDVVQENNTISLQNTAESYTDIAWYINSQLVGDHLDQFSFEKNGQYIIKQKVSNACSESTAIDTVLIDVFPSAGFSLDITKGCAPLTVNFESKATDNTSEVNWIFNGADQENISGMNPSVTYQTPGKYDIKVIATNEFGSDTIVLNEIIEVIEIPEIAFEYKANGRNVIFAAIVDEFDEVVWNFGDGNTSNDLDVEYLYEEEGTYVVTLKVTMGNCVSEFTDEITILSSSTKDLESESNFVIYPNPTKDVFTISFSDIENVEAVEILDHLGKKLHSQKVDAGTEQVLISETSNFIPGHYFVGIIRENASPMYKKVIIVR